MDRSYWSDRVDWIHWCDWYDWCDWCYWRYWCYWYDWCDWYYCVQGTVAIAYQCFISPTAGDHACIGMTLRY